MYIYIYIYTYIYIYIYIYISTCMPSYTHRMYLLHATRIIQRYAIWDCTALGFRDRSMSGRLEEISILSRVTKFWSDSS